MNLIKNLLTYIKDIFLISSIPLSRVIIIFILVFLGSSLEILSLGLIIPFVGLLFGKIDDYTIFEKFNISDEYLFIFIVFLILITSILRSIFIILINYFQTKYSQAVTIKLRSSLLSSYFLNWIIYRIRIKKFLILYIP